MKTRVLMLVGVFTVIFLSATACAGERIRDLEFSIAGSAQAYVGKYDTELYFNLPVRVGAFVTPEFELELEGIVTVWDEAAYGETEAGYIFSLNGSYNYAVDERLLSFVLAGIGFASDLPFANSITFYNGNGPRPRVLNAGGGMKFLVSPKAALRIEYRLQDFSGEKTIDTYYGNYISKIDVTVHSMFFGVSLFF